MNSSTLEMAKENLENVMHNRTKSDGLVHHNSEKIVPLDLDTNALLLTAAGILEMPELAGVAVKDYWNNFMDCFFRNGTEHVMDPYDSLCAVIAANALHVDDEGILDRCLENHLKYGLITGHSGNKAKYSCFFPVDNAMAVLAIRNNVLARQIADNTLKYLKNSEGILNPNGAEHDSRGVSLESTLADNSLAVLAAINVGRVQEAKRIFYSIEKKLSDIYSPSDPRARILIYMASLELRQQGCKTRKTHPELAKSLDFGYSVQIDALYSIAMAGRTLSDATKRK